MTNNFSQVTWVEQMAWSEMCPTCMAWKDQPCRTPKDSRGRGARFLQFNHPDRNRRFHETQKMRRRSGLQPITPSERPFW